VEEAEQVEPSHFFFSGVSYIDVSESGKMSKESRNRKASKALWLLALAMAATEIIISVWAQISGVDTAAIVFYHSGQFWLRLWDIEGLLILLALLMGLLGLVFSGGRPIFRK
jgi:hypothetical protein